MTRDRRDRERVACERCGRDVTVRRDGGVMAHRTIEGGPCTPAAWMVRRDASTSWRAPNGPIQANADRF